MRSAFLFSACALALAAAASAQEAAPQVVPISDSRPRVDVRAACRDVDDALQDALWSIVHERSLEGTVDVRFTLAGQRVADVQPSGGPRAYHARIRRAVHALQCDGRDAAPKVVHFQIRFVDEPDAAHSVALVDDEPAAPR